MDWTAFAKEIGMAGGLLFVVWKMLVWQMAYITETRNAHNEERKVWHQLDIAKSKALDELISTIKKHDEKADLRGEYIRKEHEKFAVQMDQTCTCLNEVREGLGRINGYKH